MKFFRFISVLLLAFFVCSYPKEVSTQEIRSAIAGADYIICIDGGGSKTTIHVVNARGELQNVSVRGKNCTYMKGPAGNINYVGFDKLKQTFNDLFFGLEIAGVPLDSMYERCAVVAGMAGLGNPVNREIVHSMLIDIGFDLAHIVTLSDGALALEYAGKNGIVLIDGTGSIAMTKDGDGMKRAGGFGRLIGDEGSGYAIGLKALKKTLEQELGYGTPTILMNLIKDHFSIEKLAKLIAPFHEGTILPNRIAAIAKFVFQEADQGDSVAKQIVNDAARDLGIMLKNLLIQLDGLRYNVYLIGGIFHADNSGDFIRNMSETEELVAHLQKTRQTIVFHNIANQPIAVLAVRTLLQ